LREKVIFAFSGVAKFQVKKIKRIKDAAPACVTQTGAAVIFLPKIVSSPYA
jgi:hypothetical protein